MNSVEQELLPKLSKVKQYLSARAVRQTEYQGLIAELDCLSCEISQSKPKIKIIGSDHSLVSELINISRNTAELAQQYVLEIAESKATVKNILSGCELIFLVYDRASFLPDCSHKLTSKIEKLLKRAKIKNIYIQPIIASNSTDNSDIKSNFQFLNLTLEPQFIVLNDLQSIEQYQKFLSQLSEKAIARLKTRLNNKLTRLIRNRIKDYKQLKWTKIKEVKQNCCQGQPPEAFRQKFSQLIQSLNRQQQQIFSTIKQKVHQQKSLINNPFLANSLIWQTQQIIKAAEVAITELESVNYLTPIAKVDNISQPLHLHLVDIYQQEFQAYIRQQWHNCHEVYGQGGLNTWRREIEQKLVAILGQESLTIEPCSHHNLDFEIDNLVYLPILAEGSRIPFEYSFNQSQWFKIIAAGTVGLVIYLVTKILSGTGRYFGFFILIFQFINLFTGQDAKTLRLRQQTKELKRKLESKYQILIRLSLDKITQDLIAAIDREQRFYQQQIDEIIQTTNQKIATAKKEIEIVREQINLFNEDLSQILCKLEFNRK